MIAKRSVLYGFLLGFTACFSCGAPDEATRDDSTGSAGKGGSSVSAAGSSTTAGVTSTPGGAAGTSNSGGVAGTASASGGSAGSTAGSGGSAGAEIPPPYMLDCGESGVALESHGPPQNRVNYVIVGDGYTAAELDTVYLDHINTMLEGRFSPELQPFLRYRNFVNICALQVPSVDSGIVEANPPGYGQSCQDTQDTAFDGCGNTDTRLGYINNDKVDGAISDLLPAEIEVDWKAVVLNADGWWNSGGVPMVWSGAHEDSVLAAQHEGGHTFFILADEYGGNCTFSGNEGNMRINVTKDGVNTAAKWAHWLDTTQDPGTGAQATFEGAQYCNTGAFRPSDESVMNSLWASSYFNSISLEKAIHVIYDIIDPIDEFTPESTTTPQVLDVIVIDPAVIKVEWSVDGAVVAADGGQHFDVAAQGLASGPHSISARAYDDTPWVPQDSPHGHDDLEQTVSWTITVP